MREVSGKKVYDNDKTWLFTDHTTGKPVAAYHPNCNIDDGMLWTELSKIQFTRVMYIGRFGTPNRTPRLTWAYGQVNSNMPNPQFDPDNPAHVNNILRSIPDPAVRDSQGNPNNVRDVVEYRGLDFYSEVMPPWLESLAQYCRLVSIMNFGFDPEYNSVIIGRYDEGDDQIAFHTDAESFLAHHFCANVTLGYARDFQFKTVNPDGTKQTHEIKLAHKSLFFFNGLEHALPKRASVKPGEIRYSISFRNMKNNIGIGNSFYYSRGLAGAINNEKKLVYQQELEQLQREKANQTVQAGAMGEQ